MSNKMFSYIQNHLFLRNLIIAICFTIVFLYLVSVILNIFTRHGEKYVVPNFIGKTVGECSALVNEASLSLEIIDSVYMSDRRPFEIVDQSPDPNMVVKSGRKVFVVINAAAPKMETIPYVTGFSLRQAKNMIEAKGFEISLLKYVDDVATNNVIDEEVNGKTIQKGTNLQAELGTKITLTVGQNSSSPLPLVPKVVGLSLREAKSRLWEIGLNVGHIIGDGSYKKEDISKARIWKQEPNQQQHSTYGASVKLYLTVDDQRVKSGVKASDEQICTIVETDEDLLDSEE